MDSSGSSASGDSAAADLAPLLNDPEFARAYEVQENLGTGAFSVVFRARHRSTGRVVAMKGLTALTGNESVERFLREGRMMARLSHPHIARVYDVGVSGGIPWMALELVEGGTLEDRATEPWAIADVLRLLHPVAAALGHCHRRDIVHRDLKPANILIDAEGKPRVADFGLAQCDREGKRLTQAGTVMGTPRYMAPESVLGDAIGPAADVYAIGLVMFELLTARTPYDAVSPQEFLMAHAYAEPMKLATLRPDAPPALCDLVDRCLAKLPDKRPASGAELAAAIALVARTTERDADTSLAGDVSVTSLDLKPDASAQAVRAQLGLKAASEGSSRLATAISLVVTVFLVGVLVLADKSLSGFTPQAKSAAFQIDTRALGTYSTGGAAATRLAFSQDGSRLVAGCADGFVRCFDLSQPSARPRTLEASGPVQDVAISVAARFVACTSESGQASIFDISKDDKTSVKRLLAPARALAFVPGPASGGALTERLALLAPDLALRLLDPGGDRPGQALRPDRSSNGRAVLAMAAGPPGTYFALTGPSIPLQIVRLEVAGDALRASPAGSFLESPVAWATGNATAHAPAWFALARNAAGPLGPRVLVDAYELGPTVRGYRSLEPPVVPRALLAMPVPGYLVVGGESGEVALALLDTQAGESLADWRSWIAHRQRITALAMHHEGRLLATAAADGAVRLWGVRQEPRGR